jgi:hypothetical protein
LLSLIVHQNNGSTGQNLVNSKAFLNKLEFNLIF